MIENLETEIQVNNLDEKTMKTLVKENKDDVKIKLFYVGKKFEVDTFFVIIDKLISELDRRLNSYNLFLSQFKFLVNFKTYNDPDIDSLNNCIQFYHIK